MDLGEKSYIIVFCKIVYVQTKHAEQESKEEDLLRGGLFFCWRFVVIKAANWENSDKCFHFLVETSNANIGSENSYF